ncbi:MULTISPECIES: hypothetical protein [unclassified Klebsiella]|uniref:hypothetical protein n=1 Tax=unclassified Klebsiella TaxID=2608929 RepID=UPI000C2A6895|nr:MULTISPECIES: hypothetical protein [unclassified Klebsiella]PJX56339.1 hypothetical protein CWM63_26435 [Klebsiella sp. F-Nf9]PKJ69007.1 hypothetical protein CW267_19325 [Klebsiella sp. X1-16S-Nf21]HDU3862794.1 hypothetical protein [Klebsiella quasipneumoniae subsp. quasipneumoniae]
MKRIYLDQNIWFDIRFERFDTSLESVLKKIDRDRVEIIYSPAHCEEICNSYCSPNISNHITTEEKDLRISILSKVTRNREIVPYSNDFKIMHSFCGREGPYVVLEHPTACFKRVYDNYESNEVAESSQQHSVDKADEVEQDLKSKLGHANIINVLETDPSAKALLLQNLTSKLIHRAAINQLIKSNIKIQPCTAQVKKIIDEKAHEIRYMQSAYFINKAEKILNNRNKTKFSSEGFDISEAVVDAVILTMIELGYASSEVSMSSLHDNTHSIYGVYCDYFVSRDQKLLKKLIPAYEYLGINTKIINAKYEDWQTYLS